MGLLRVHATASPAIAAKAAAAPIAVHDLCQTFTVVPGIDAECMGAYNRTPTTHHREVGVCCIAREARTAQAPFTLQGNRLLHVQAGHGRISHPGADVESHVGRLVVG
jgi:hypothetical protein